MNSINKNSLAWSSCSLLFESDELSRVAGSVKSS